MNDYTELKTFRYERKFLADPYTRGATEAIIQQNHAFFVPAFYPRKINNIYFDTPGLDCYFDNLFGNGSRWKVRIRWYGDKFGNVKAPILEFKIKQGLTGTKKSYILPDFTFVESQFDATVLHKLFHSDRLAPEVIEKVQGLQPVLFNSYKRSYFTTLDRKFRITVDDEMEYSNLRPSWNNMGHIYKEPQKTVVELKYDHDFDSEAERITNEFPFRLDKNSKFVSGMSHFRSEIAL